MINRFLIIQTASIGDVILATPILEKLHLFYPEAQIDILIRKGYEGLFENHPFLHRLWLWDKKEDKYKNLLKLITDIRKAKIDVVINLQRFASTGLVTCCSGASEKIGFNKNPFSLFFTKKIKHHIKDKNIHEIDRNLSLIESLTDNSRILPRLYPNESAFYKVKEWKSKPYICVAPASLWFTKQFPKEKWSQFLALIPKDLQVFLLGSKADIELCEQIQKQSGNKKITILAGKLSLLESAALMKDAKMNFVNDSAPMHLASSVNAPTTAIYCSTVISFGFGPLSENAVVVETNNKLDCRPCGLHGYQKCPKSHFNCAQTILIDKLLEKL